MALSHVSHTAFPSVVSHALDFARPSWELFGKTRGLPGIASRLVSDLKVLVPVSVANQRVNSTCLAISGNATHLIATKRGLYTLGPEGLFLVLQGEFYGLTRFEGLWYAFERLRSRGRLLRFQLVGQRITVAHQLAASFSAGCHQIDFLGNELHIADTYNNALQVYGLSRKHVDQRAIVFPLGTLRAGRESENYGHLNSIWSGAEGTYAMLHNETSKTGKASEIVRLDERLRIVERFQTPASHAHNIIYYRGRPLYCDSQRGRLLWGTEEVFSCDYFTRGLSISHEHVLLGGSAYGKRVERDELRGAVFLLSRDFKLIDRIDVPGMVQEIRRIDAPDLSLSNDARQETVRQASA